MRHDLTHRASGRRTEPAFISTLRAKWQGRPCHYCGRTDLPIEVDHVRELWQGGTNHPSNLVPSCGPCNKTKSLALRAGRQTVRPRQPTRVWRRLRATRD